MSAWRSVFISPDHPHPPYDVVLEQATFPCDSRPVVFAQHALPPQCPFCQLASCSERATVVRSYSSPLRCAAPRCVLVRRTLGCAYRNGFGGLLHVGVSDSQGRVYHFNGQGLHAAEESLPNWSECLSIPLERSQLSHSDWDAALRSFHQRCRQPALWPRYHEINHNCFDFAIGFLNSISYGGTSSLDKMSFARTYLEHEVNVATDFLAAYTALLASTRNLLVGTSAGPPGHTSAATLGDVLGRTATCAHCQQRLSAAFAICEVNGQRCRLCSDCSSNARVVLHVASAPSYSCDVCGASPLWPGDHFHCEVCEDFDLCARCMQLCATGPPPAGARGHSRAHTVLEI